MGQYLSSQGNNSDAISVHQYDFERTRPIVLVALVAKKVLVIPARREHSILIQPTVPHAGGNVRGGFGKGQNGLDRGRLGEQFNGGEIGARKRQRVE